MASVDEAWWDGHLLDDPPITPLVFSLVADGDDMPASLYDGPVPLWSDRLVNAMRQAGVDNFEAYPVELDGPRVGEESPIYWAVNVLGLVAAVDLERSQLKLGDERADPEPEQLVLDDKKAAAFRMFRLMESPDLVLVDAEVRASLERQGLADLEFTHVGPDQ
jgi:hypothetical protein